MLKHYPLLKLLVFSITLLPFKAMGQLTNPNLWNLATSDYSFTGFALYNSNYSVNMKGHAFPSARDLSNLNDDGNQNVTLQNALFNITVGCIRNEIANGISILNGTGNTLGAIVVGINATNRSNLTVTYTAAQTTDGASRINGLRLQYRIGSTGSYTDILPLSEYLTALSGTNAPATFTNIPLPAVVDNQPVVYVRWVYYSYSGSSTLDRIRLDDITVSSTPYVTPSVAISSANASPATITQGTSDVILQRYDLAVTNGNTTLNGLALTTAGTYAASDISNLKVRYSMDSVLDVGDATLSTIVPNVAGTQTFTSFVSQQINNGDTGYVFVTADIAASATPGNTIQVSTTSFSDISFAGSITKTGTDPVAASGTKTFVAPTPDVTLTSANPAISSGTLIQNTSGNILYAFDLSVTTSDATLTDLNATTTGTYNASDLNNLKAWYSSDNSLDTATDVLLGTQTSALGAGSHSFSSLSQLILAGSTGYIFITTDLPCTATAGNTISVNAIAASDISFTAANVTANTYAGDVQTIASATPTNATSVVISSLDASAAISWADPSSCFEEVIIVAAPTANTGVPTGDGSSYTADLVYGNGTVLGNGYVIYKGTNSPQTITGLTNDSTYYFKVFTRNDNIWSSGVEVSATPAQAVVAGEVLINRFSPEYAAANDEYVELVNTTDRAIDLAQLKLDYQSGTGTGSNTSVLSGVVPAHGFWLLSPNAMVTVGNASLSADGSYTAAFAASDGQLALLRANDNVKIDGVAYGSISGGTYMEGTASSNPPATGGLQRIIDGADSNNNSTDFTTVSNANIYLRNSSSRLANSGAVIPAGTYTDVVVTGNASLTGNVIISNKLELISDALSVGGNTLTLNGTVDGAGVLSTSSTSNLEIGSNAGTIGFLATGNGLNDLTLQNNASLTLGATLNLYGLLSINSGATLNTGNNLVLKSSASDTAAVVGPVSGSINGIVTVERYISAPSGGASTGRAWHLVTAPLSGSTGNSIYQNWQNNGVNNGNGVEIWGPSGPGLATGPSYSMYSYNVSGNNYQSVSNTTTTPLFTASGNKAFLLFTSGAYGSGNIASGSAPSVLSASGNLITGTQTYSFMPSGTHDLEVLGNPYACPVDFDAIWNNTGTANIHRKFWVVDPAKNDIGGYVLVQWNAFTVSYDVIPSSAQNQYIQNGQAFFVQATGSSAGTVTIEENDKAVASTQTAVFRQNGGALETFHVNLNAVPATGSPYQIDGALVNCHQNYSNTVSATEDGAKFLNFNESLYIREGNEKLAIDNRELYDDGDTLKVGLSGMRQRSYQLELLPLNINVPGLTATLYDAYLNTTQTVPLSGGLTYAFNVTSAAASGSASRFFIVFSNPSPLALNNIEVRAVANEAGQAVVSWNATDEGQIVRYEVEKSSNGKTFSNQLTVATAAKEIYQWIDATPSNQNYYRIKAVTKDRKMVYSKVVSLSFSNDHPNISIFPNPVGNELQLKMQNSAPATYSVAIFGSQGQKVIETVVITNGASEQHIITVKALPAGVYQIQVTDEQGNRVHMEKFIKQ
jgi:hypothetical protein